MQEMTGTGSGLAQRVMQEVMDTPALKEIILLHMRGVRPERASGLAEILLWRDPAMAMSFFGSAPAAANWLLVFLQELGEQLRTIPTPLLRDILGRVVSGVDKERAGRVASTYAGLARELAGAGEGKGTAALVNGLNSLILRLDDLTAPMQEDPARAAEALGTAMRQLDTAALRRVLRRLARVFLERVKPGSAGGRLAAARSGPGRSGGWRRFMYGYNVALCLTLGPAMMLRQSLPRRLLRWPWEDPVMMGIYGSMVTSVGLLSAAALLDEKKEQSYLPVFYAQMLYKSMTCLLLRSRLRRGGNGRWGMRVLFWFFASYIVMLAGAVGDREMPRGAEEAAR